MRRLLSAVLSLAVLLGPVGSACHAVLHLGGDQPAEFSAHDDAHHHAHREVDHHAGCAFCVHTKCAGAVLATAPSLAYASRDAGRVAHAADGAPTDVTLASSAARAPPSLS